METLSLCVIYSKTQMLKSSIEVLPGDLPVNRGILPLFRVKEEIMKTDSGFELGGMDKTVLSVGSLFDDEGDRVYWLSLSPIERLSCLELNRRIVYGYGDSYPRFQRLLEIAQRKGC
jgi:hypothetical protein